MWNFINFLETLKSKSRRERHKKAKSKPSQIKQQVPVDTMPLCLRKLYGLLCVMLIYVNMKLYFGCSCTCIVNKELIAVVLLWLLPARYKSSMPIIVIIKKNTGIIKFYIIFQQWLKQDDCNQIQPFKLISIIFTSKEDNVIGTS